METIIVPLFFTFLIGLIALPLLSKRVLDKLTDLVFKITELKLRRKGKTVRHVIPPGKGDGVPGKSNLKRDDSQTRR